MKKFIAAKNAELCSKAGGGAIQEVARGMLASGLVDRVLTFAKGLDEKDLLPVFIDKADDVGNMALNAYVPYSLSRFARDYGEGKLAVIGRTCDIRALLELRKRNGLNGADLLTVGIVCSETPDRPNCLRCEYRVPFMADLSCVLAEDGTLVEATGDKGAEVLDVGSFEELSPPNQAFDAEAARQVALAEQAAAFELQQASPAERLAYWFGQFDKCIKCFGCRNSCPLCYCKDCVLEADRGLVPGGEIAPPRLFHLTRLAHVADSCLNCGQCEAACPMGIPIAKLYHMLNKELSAVFGFTPGINADLPPLFGFDEKEKSNDSTLFRRR